MRRLTLFPLMALAVLLTAGLALATPFPANVQNDVYGVAQGGGVNGIPTARDNNDGLPDINDAINLLLGTAYSRNANIDFLFHEPDTIWKQLNGGAALIGLTAANNNTLGVYTDLGGGTVKTPIIGPYSGFGFLGDGTAANPYPAAAVPNSVVPHGDLFGWYLESTTSGGSTKTYFSEAVLNAGGWDHMMTFHLEELAGTTIYVQVGEEVFAYTLNDPWLICWEDLPYSNGKLGDEDYDDMMFLVDKVRPIPEPATMLLVGAGLLGVGAFRRKFRR